MYLDNKSSSQSILSNVYMCTYFLTLKRYRKPYSQKNFLVDRYYMTKRYYDTINLWLSVNHFYLETSKNHTSLR